MDAARPRGRPPLRLALAASVFIALAVLGARPAAVAPSDAIGRSGTIGGAPYRMQAPREWNGSGLVVFAHGVQPEAPGPGDLVAPPIAVHLATSGYAWVASGYRARGYRPDWYIEDLFRARERFIEAFGEPKWTIIYGQSMGGHITVASLELRPGVYQAGLAECGARPITTRRRDAGSTAS